MRTLITTLIIIGLAVLSPSFAKKPAWAGKYKSEKYETKSMRDRSDDSDYKFGKKHEKSKEIREKAWEKREKNKGKYPERRKKDSDYKNSDDLDVKKEKKLKKDKVNTGLEKQREKKSEKVQKELGKGSEQGQESRKKRKKWWKFWESDTE